MVANFAFNPYVTTNAAGTFYIKSDGYIQGQAMDDPSARNWLAGGVLAQTETLPMWGGVGISETTSPVTGGPPNGELGGNITRATTQTANAAGQLTGFSVFDQNYANVNSPQSPVPLSGSGMLVNFYRLGSNARIAVKCDPALVSAGGSIITQKVSWDVVNQLLIPFSAAALTVASGTYVPSTGLVTLTMSAPVTFTAGDSIAVSSLTGTGAFASLNGTYTTLSASGTTVTYTGPLNAGAATITGGSVSVGGTGTAGSILPVKLLNINIGNSMAVKYDPVTGFATWDRNASCALIQL